MDERHAWGTAVLAVSIGVYGATVHPSVAGGDAGELATVAHGLGVAHPPGYPTLTMLTWLGERVGAAVMPTADLGLLQNLFHAMMSGVANTFLYYCSTELTNSIPSGLISAAIFGFAPIVWTYSTHIEVFSLNNLLITLLELLCVLYYKHRTMPIVYFGAFISGLSLTNQHTSVLYVAPFILWVAGWEYKRLLNIKRILVLGVCFALGMAPYLYLVWSAMFMVNANSWGACSTWDGFLTHFFRKEYGTFSLASQESNYKVQNFKRAWIYYLWDTKNQTLQVLWVFAVLAIILSLAHLRRLRVAPDTIFAITLALYLNFFNYLCNLPIDRPLFYGVQQRFWIQPLSLVAIFVGKGITDTVSFVCKASPRVSTVLLYGVAACVTMLQAGLHYREMDQSENYIVHDFGKAILTPLPKDSIVLTKGDLMINSARYVQAMHGVRPDVRIIDQEMMTYDWYIASLKQAYPDVRFPGSYYYPNRRGAYDIAMFYAANKKRRIFLAHGFKDGDHSWEGKYTVVPFGIIHEMVTEKAKNTRTMKKLQRYLQEIHNAVPAPEDFSLPPQGKYADHTWEQVVKNDYWMGFHNEGYTLLDWANKEAERNPSDVSIDGQQYLAISEARKIFAMLAKHDQLPNGIAHRNLGVVLQTLHKYHPTDRSLVVEMRDAFSGYIRRVPQAPKAQLEQIETAVKYYDSVLKTMQ